MTQRPLIVACTGSGKSILQGAICRSAEARLPEGKRVVVAVPTVGLVRQLAKTLRLFCKDVGVFYGVKKQPEAAVIVVCYKSLTKLATALDELGAGTRLLILDEAHRSERPDNRAGIEALNSDHLCGATATAFLSDKSRSLSLFGCVPFKYTIEEAIRDGVLVPPVAVQVEEDWHGWGGDPAAMVDLWCAERIAGLAGPGVCSANNIADAEGYAKYLRAFGVAAAPIHSGLELKEQEDIIGALENGSLKCAVHPVMMSEGVDIPQLMWMCLRRTASNPVRLVQEVGRGLRAFPDKRHCIVLDPHGIFRALGLTHAHSIGGEMDAILAAETQDRDPTGESRAPGIMPPPMAVSATSQWARLLLLELQVAGLAEPSLAGGWRDERAPSPKQVDYLRQLNKRFVGSLPERVKARFKSLAKEDVLQQLPAGAVSDLIGVLEVIEAGAPKPSPGQAPWEARRGWQYPWPEGLDFPELAAGAVAGLGGRVSRDERTALRRAAKGAA